MKNKNSSISRQKGEKLIIEINKDIEKYQESVCLGLSAKQLIYSILALLSGCLIVFFLYERIGLTFSCYVAVPVVAPIALCGFYSYNGMGFREVYTRYMKSVFCNRTFIFRAGGYREMMAELRALEMKQRKEEELERKRIRKKKIKFNRKNIKS